MKLVQFFLPGKGKRVGLVRGNAVADITSAEEGVCSTLDLLETGNTAAGVLTRTEWLSRRSHRKALGYQDLQRPPSRRAPHLLAPIEPVEIWALEPVEITAAPPPLSNRPQLFFKGTAARAIGPHARAPVRADSEDTRARPALAAVLGAGEEILAFSISLDFVAADLAQLGSGYLTQAIAYFGSCALGPCLVTPDELANTSGLQMSWRIVSNGVTRVTESVRVPGAVQRLQQAIPWVRSDPAIALGTVLLSPILLSGPVQAALVENDQVELEVEGIGRLATTVTRAGTPRKPHTV